MGFGKNPKRLNIKPKKFNKWDDIDKLYAKRCKSSHYKKDEKLRKQTQLGVFYKKT